MPQAGKPEWAGGGVEESDLGERFQEPIGVSVRLVETE